MKKKLPFKLSACVDVAIKDHQSVGRSPYYSFNMDTWHMPDDDTCEVCFAGALMARTLKVPWTLTKGPEDFKEYSRVRLYALDCFRLGHLKSAFRHMNWVFPDKLLLKEVKVTRFDQDNPAPFYASMRIVRDLLKAIGY